MLPPALPPLAVFVTLPVNTPLEGAPKFARFNRLKISARNWRDPCSPRNPSLVSLLMERSQFPTPGPRRVSRGVLGSVPSACSPNISGLNQFVGLPRITVSRLYGIQLYGTGVPEIVNE